MDLVLLSTEKRVSLDILHQLVNMLKLQQQDGAPDAERVLI